MSQHVRNLISRGTLLIIAVALLYSGVFCVSKARLLYRDELQRRQVQPPPAKMNGGFMMVGCVGVILCGGGLLAALGGLAPSSWIERLLGRPTNTTLHENPETWPIDLID